MNFPLLPDASMREAARRVYGEDPAGYEAGRPDYPARVFELLLDPCGLGPGRAVLEIGPGPGRVTRRLLQAGAVVTVVEPDPGLASHLRGDERVAQVVESDFETADLPDQGFDLVVAAMAWHWVDQAVGLPKLRRVLRPGGWATLWWTLFADPTRPDPFREATRHLVPLPPARHPDGRPPMELDADGWRRALEGPAGLTEVLSERIEWNPRLDATAIRALYASTILIRRLPPDEQVRVLDEVERVARDEFGGMVERPMVTGFYAARQPRRLGSDGP